MGRLRVLTLIAHWQCKVKSWGVVCSLYESIIDEIEAGECQWSDDFSSHETMLPSVSWDPKDTHMDKHVDKGRKLPELYWCKAYQSNSCDSTAPHMAQIKANEAPVPWTRKNKL